MNILSPLLDRSLAAASQGAEVPGFSVTSIVTTIGDWAGLLEDDPHGRLGMLMSGLAGAAAALAVAIVLTLYFQNRERTTRDVIRHGLAAIAVLGLTAFVAYDIRHAALAYLGINPTKPAVEFEIRLPKAVLTTVADTQIELRTDRNQKLAQVQDALASTSDGRNVLKGTVTLDYRTTERMVVLNLPGQAQCQFRLRLPASPSHSDAFGPWHLADGIVPVKGNAATGETNDAFAIRYRVL